MSIKVKNKMNNYSPNMLKTFDDCQQKFFFKYIEKRSMPQRAVFFEKGKKVHALANYYLNSENIDKLEKALSIDARIAWDTLKANRYFKLNVINTEYNLSCKVENYWVGGRLDALVSDGENYFILDYKTGNIPPNAEQDFQTIVYLLCTDKYLKKRNCTKPISFVYLGLRDNIEKQILLNSELKTNYEEKITSICKKIDFAVTSNVFSKNTKSCKNCEYNKICQTNLDLTGDLE